MKQKKHSAVLNLSNQANFIGADSSDLYQYNFVVMIGESYLNRIDDINTKMPLSINISKSGEIEIVSFDKNKIDNNGNIKIYSDIKISNSEQPNIKEEGI